MAGRARACCNFPDATAVDRGGRAPLRAHPGAAHLLVAAGAARGAQPGIAGRAGARVPGAGLRCGAAGGGLARRPRSHLGTGARRPYGVCTAGAAVRRGRRRGARCRGAGRLCPEPRGPRSRHLRAGADRGRGSPGARARGVAHQPREALRLAAAIARALATIHAAGVLHRDLKPGNIMLREDGGIALIDFGLSKDAALALDVTDSGTIFGTPHYMSPEQGHGEPVDARSDLYSLGVILFEMLTGEKPYRAENPMAIVYKHRKEPVPQLPPQFAAMQPVLEGLLAKAPADRFAGAPQAAEALQGTLDRWLARGAQP